MEDEPPKRPDAALGGHYIPGQPPPLGPDADIGPTDPRHGGRQSQGVGLGARVAGGAGILALLAGKAKFLFFIFKLGPFGLSMLLSIALYATFYGLPFALGLIGLLFVHEFGHVIAIRLKGGPVTLPFFIPFMGAAIFLRSQPHDAAEEAFIGAGGPILGSAGALAAFFIYSITGNGFWLGLSYFGFFINLFNLLPVVPLDGGRILAPTWRGVWVIGLIMAVGLAILLPHNVILWLIAIVAAFQVWGRLRGKAEQPDYYAVTPRERLTYGAIYLGLLGGLGFMTHYTLLLSGGFRPGQ